MFYILFQIALLSLIALSFIMIVGVPVAYATPQYWDDSKKFLWLGSIAWFGLVIIVGILNFLVV